MCTKLRGRLAGPLLNKLQSFLNSLIRLLTRLVHQLAPIGIVGRAAPSKLLCWVGCPRKIFSKILFSGFSWFFFKFFRFFLNVISRFKKRSKLWAQLYADNPFLDQKRHNQWLHRVDHFDPNFPRKLPFYPKAKLYSDFVDRLTCSTPSYESLRHLHLEGILVAVVALFGFFLDSSRLSVEFEKLNL